MSTGNSPEVTQPPGTSRGDAAVRAVPERRLSTFDATVMVVGLVLGVGIFRAPQLVAANSEDAWTFLALWVAGGLVSLIGALCYAELATAYPSAGGEYHFVSRALGRGVGFLFAWSRMTVLQTGSIALLAYLFADYARPLVAATVPLTADGRAGPILAGAVVVGLTAVNVLGMRPGRTAQYVLTSVEVAGLLALVGAIFLLPHAPVVVPPPPAREGHLGLAMVFVLLTYGGWSEAAYLSAEMRDKRRGITRALLAGIAVITLLYLLANLAYLDALGLSGMAGSSTLAADVMRAAGGAAGAVALSVVVMVSALSSANASMITGARSNFAVGRDVSWLRPLALWHTGRGTPTNALLLQGGITLALVLFGALARSGFEAMVAYTAPVFWSILLLTGVSLFVLRHRDARTERPFRVPLYPVVPGLFCAASAFMLYASIAYAGRGALWGLAVMALGVPLYALGSVSAGPPGGLVDRKSPPPREEAPCV